MILIILAYEWIISLGEVIEKKSKNVSQDQPFLSEDEGIEWAKKSLDFGFEAGVECCVIIPTRAGNGSLEQLQNDGYFAPPNIRSLEEVLEYGIELKAGRVFADLWDIHKFSDCDKCLDSRIDGIGDMNLSQQIGMKVECSWCS